ncbi:MAG TPA: hypothetical protein VFI83_08450 [Gaiella sp.]|jgi:hypothetical protein|nr:hypothetical protein [Gaiella sp.]
MPRGSDVVFVVDLSPAQARSLGETLATAAVVGNVDPGQGLVVVPYAQNRIFGRDDLLAVVREWIDEHGARNASLRLRADVATSRFPSASCARPARSA